ncbi:hypothetical protein M569_15612, partial [Genlisea aurea]
VTVVEYLRSSMSKELLTKFPDNTPFDFDYSQSSIWSPLLPRRLPPESFLLLDEDDGVGLLRCTRRRITTGIKNKTFTALLHKVCKRHKMKRRRRK